MWYDIRMSEQIAVRLSNDLVHRLDAAVRDGAFPSRAEAVRVALGDLLDNLRRRQVGEAIADGYRRQPQTDADVKIAEAAAIRSINEEPGELDPPAARCGGVRRPTPRAGPTWC
jgi:Arc/MetJ-type ribon-helix-helix transcriptional regulator